MVQQSTWMDWARGALRAGVAPVVMGARLAFHDTALDDPEVPEVRDAWSTRAKILLDEIAFATEIASARVLPASQLARASAEQDQAIAFLEEGGYYADPESYHLIPSAPERVVLDRARHADISYRHIRFESGYEPHAGEPGAQRWQAQVPNRTAHAWLLRHRGEERPWVMCVPGYRMGSPIMDFAAFRVRWLYRTLGLNVAVPVLPLHGPRCEGRRGGDGFFTGDFLDTLHAQAQAVWDLRRLIAWLREHGAPAIGIHGVSLGGYTAALLASLEEGLEYVVAGIPAIDVARLMGAHVPGPLQKFTEAAGFSLERIARVMWPVSPLALQPKVPHAGRHLYAGLVDRLTPPDHARDLWVHWDRPNACFYQGGHVSFLFDAGVRQLMLDALRGARFL